MRCPKCHYLSFEPEPRCKNCGYGFSLNESDLPMRDPDPTEGPLVDIALRPGPGGLALLTPLEPTVERTSKPAVPELPEAVVPAASTQQPEDSQEPMQRLMERLRPSAPPTTELPLFVKALSASEPTSPNDMPVTPAGEARPPLVVRRRAESPAPVARPSARPAASRKLGPLDRDLLDDLQRIEKIERKEAASEARLAAQAALPADRAGAQKRLGAALIDATLLSGLVSALLWITLRWCDLPLDRALSLPMLPTGAFFLLVGVSYLLMFTAAGGQTIGKMILRIRVVDEAAQPDTFPTLTLKQAVYRELLALPSILALGAGFVPALVGDERALHDRLAHTRVVRV